MSTNDSNPPISSFLKIFTVFELIVLIVAGFGTLFLQAVTRPIWPWDVAPFNIAFIGVIYLASVVPFVMVLAGGRWGLARLVLRMQLVFTGMALIASLLNLGQFQFQRWATWAWFFLYITLPLNAAVHLWLYRHTPPAPRVPVPAAWRNTLLAQSVVLGVYGLAQFFVPGAVSGFWPWAVDAFHGQIYSGAFVTLAVGGVMAARGLARAEVVALSASQIGIALFAVGGLALVDANVHRVNWGAAGTWVWIGAFAVIGIAGLVMLRIGQGAGSTNS